MSRALSDFSDVRSSAETSVSELVRDLQQLGRKVRGERRLYRESLQLLARHYHSPYVAISIELQSGPLDEAVQHKGDGDSQWRELCLLAMVDAQHRDQASAKFYDSSALKRRFAVLAVPLHDHGKSVGALAVVVECKTKPKVERHLQELVHFANAAETLALLVAERQRQSTRASREPLVEPLASVAQFKNATELAFSITNNLKSRFGIDEVALGVVRRQRIRVLAVSGREDVPKKSPGVRVLKSAMEECADSKQVTAYPPIPGRDGGASLLHKRWHRDMGESVVASIPFVNGDQCMAVVSLRNRPGKPFDSDDIEKVHKAVAPFLPILVLLQKADRAVWQTLLDRVHDRILKKPEARLRRLLMLTVLVVTIGIMFLPVPYRFTVPCEVRPDYVVHLTAPFAGMIVSSNLHPGDRVKKGQELARFDTHELQIERRKLVAELEIAKTKLYAALAGADDDSARQADAERKVAESKLNLIELKIQRAVVVAPSDGVILSGDGGERNGQYAQLGELLYTLGTDDRLRIELHIPEHCLPYTRVGATCTVVPMAQAEERRTFRLQHVAATATVSQEQSYFVADGILEPLGDADVLRVGMTGFAKVDSARRPLWWICTRKIADTLRIQLWRL